MSYTILIVDDSSATRAVVKRAIRRCGFGPIQFLDAPDGEAGLGLLAGAKVDLVIADLNMPVMDGFEMTRRIRGNSSTKSIPIVIISAAPDAEEFAQSQGADVFLPKPFTPEEMGDVVSRFIKGKADAQLT